MPFRSFACSRGFNIVPLPRTQGVRSRFLRQIQTFLPGVLCEGSALHAD